jgi:hypothetical protein
MRPLSSFLFSRRAARPDLAIRARRSSSALGLSVALAASAAGCEVRGSMQVASGPSLVQVEPSLWVLPDADAATYYDGASYWYVDSGGWYRRSYWNDPWLRIDIGGVPSGLAGHNHRTFVRYHGTGRIIHGPTRGRGGVGRGRR